MGLAPARQNKTALTLRIETVIKSRNVRGNRAHAP